MEEEQVKQEDQNLVKSEVVEKQGLNFTSSPFIIGAIVVIGLGVATGYLLSSKKLTPGTAGTLKKEAKSGELAAGTVFGSDDLKTFKDTTEGILKKGGTDGEGSHHLERQGGESQNVYLTSSIIDLNEFIDKKIKIWGETNKARKAGWLMDVGRVEILE